MKKGLKTIAEVSCDYRDDETGKYTIDVWLTGDDEEEGFVIAEVDADGNVEWRSWMGAVEYDRTPILEAIEDAKKKQAEMKQYLIDDCIEAIKWDIASGDITALEELLKFVPSKSLKSFLPRK